MDQLLLPYLQATKESDSQRCLDELILFHVAPIVRKVLRQKLGFHVDQFGTNRHNQDAEDLYQEVLTKAIQALVELKSSSASEIEHFPQYVSRTAANTCVNYLRSKSPARRRLKDRIRLLLISPRDFAFWEDDGQFLCGFSEWQSRPKSAFSRADDEQIAEMVSQLLTERYPTLAPTQVSLLKMVPELFNLTEAPIEIDRVVNILAIVLRLQDHAVASIGDSQEAEKVSRIAEAASDNLRDDPQRLFRSLWNALRRLPTHQRDAFCFRFHDQSGDDLFSLLIATRTATLPEIAETFGRSEHEIIRLRSLMPMDGATAASELNTSRTEVHRWRFRALKRLRKELIEPPDKSK